MSFDRRTLMRGVAVAGLAGVALPGTAAASELEFHIRHQFRPFDLIAPRFVQYDAPARTGTVATGVRPVAPFCSVLVRSSGAVAAGLVGGGNSVLGRYAAGAVTIEVTVGGATTVVASAAAELPEGAGFAVVVNENAVTVLADTGGWRPLLTNRDGVRALIDLRDPRVLRRLSYGYEGATGRVRAGVLRAGGRA